MSNFCTVSYTCEAPKEQLDELYAVLTSLQHTEIPVVENGQGTLSLACVVRQLGGDWQQVDCRGVVTDFRREKNGTLSMEQYTDWCEQTGFRKFLEQRFHGMKIYFLEVETGFEVYQTNDVAGRYFPERYFLEANDGFQYFTTLEEAANEVSEVVGFRVEPDVDGITEAIEVYLSEHEADDVFLGFHEIVVAQD